MTRDTTADGSRLTSRRTAAFALLAVVCILLAGAAVVTAQQSQQIYQEDWEGDNPLQDYSTDVPPTAYSLVEVTDSTASNGTHSLHLRTDTNEGNDGRTTAVYDDNVTVGSSTPDFYSEFSLRLRGDTQLGSFDPNFMPEPSLTVSDGNETVSMRSSAGDLAVGGTLVNNTNLGETIPANTWRRISLEANGTHAILDVDGSEAVAAELNGTWDDPDNIRVRYSLQSDTDEVETEAWFDDIYVSAVPPGEEVSEDLRLDVPGYLPHNETGRYSVEANDSGVWRDVTDEATVTPSNPDAVTFYPSNSTVVASGNKSINERVDLTAEYQGLNATDHMVVATTTVDNLDLLPAWWKVNATLSDWTMIWILLATLIATAASRMATTFAGIGGFVMAMIMGWIMGDVPDGIMVATIFMGIFIGLNLAANIDYSVR